MVIKSANKSIFPAFFLAAALFVTACADGGSSGTVATEEPPLPGLASPPNINWVNEKMGKMASYDALTGNMGDDNCLEEIPDSGWTQDWSQVVQNTSFELVEDKKDLYDHLNVSYSTSMNSAVYSQTAEYKMTNDLELDSNSIYALLKIDVSGPVVRRTAKMSAEKGFYNNPALIDTVSFRNECGDMAITRVHTGGKFYGLLKITTKNLNEKSSIQASMSEKIKAGAISFNNKTDFANQFSISEDSFSITSQVYTVGGLQGKIVQSVEDLVTEANAWLSDTARLFQLTADERIDLWNSGSKNFNTFTSNKLNDLLTSNAISGDFTPYSEAIWGKSANSKKPAVLTNIASMGELGRAYVSTQIVLENLSTVINSPELYVTSHYPLVLFGTSSLTQYPMLNVPASTPGYTVANSADALTHLETVRSEIEESKSDLLLAARICSGNSGNSEPSLAEACEEACAPDAVINTDPDATTEQCMENCTGTGACNIVYRHLLMEPSHKVVEIENTYGQPDGLPGRFSYRTAGNADWTDVGLPERRTYVPVQCEDYKKEVGAASMPDGDYIFYYDGNPLRPIYFYCRNMNSTVPITYLTLNNHVSAYPASEPSHQGFDGNANYTGIRTAAGWQGIYFNKYRVSQSEGMVMLNDDKRYSLNPHSLTSFFRTASQDDEWSSFDLDLRGTPLEISHDQQFLGGGFCNFDPSYLFGIVRISTTSETADKHDNRVIQRMRAAINGDNGHIYPVPYTTFAEGSTDNDGTHYLLPTHGEGSMRLNYIDKSVQGLVKLHQTQEDHITITTPISHKATTGLGDKIESFKEMPLP